jgi:hypothetical protein
VWFPEIDNYLPTDQRLLVGTMTDLRDDEHTLKSLGTERPVEYMEGVSLAETIGAMGYLEGSALTGDVAEIFQEIFEWGLFKFEYKPTSEDPDEVVRNYRFKGHRTAIKNARKI